MNWVGAFAPGTVGGRRAHPPKASKVWWKKINEKERIKSIRSAIAATMLKEVVSQRGHMVPGNYPFVLDDKFEQLDKTKEIVGIFKKLGLEKELQRTEHKQVRHGKGKSRGRKYKKSKGPLIIVSKKGNLHNAAKNISGIEVVEVRSLNTELLAPGAKAGRLALWTSAAIEIMKKEELFK